MGMREILKITIFAAAIVAVILWLCPAKYDSTDTPIELDMSLRRDTVTVVEHDTVTVAAPLLRVEPLPRYVIARLERPAHADTVHDTVEVVVPLSRYEYSDSMARVVATGFAVSIDTIQVYAPTRISTLTVTRTERRRWAIGPTLSIGIDSRGHPAVLIGGGVTFGIY